MKKTDINGAKLNGTYHIIQKNGMVKTSYYRDGEQLSFYKYPNINMPFKSPLIRWENLQITTSKQSIADVINGFRPYSSDCHCTLEEGLKYVQLAKDAGLPYSLANSQTVLNGKVDPNIFKFSISQNGTIGELFNIDTVLVSYVLLFGERADYSFYSHLNEELLSVNSQKLSDFFIWPRNMPMEIAGLIQGTPLEATYHYINRIIKEREGM